LYQSVQMKISPPVCPLYVPAILHFSYLFAISTSIVNNLLNCDSLSIQCITDLLTS
jgi:hypothetical protein